MKKLFQGWNAEVAANTPHWTHYSDSAPPALNDSVPITVETKKNIVLEEIICIIRKTDNFRQHYNTEN